MTRFRAFCFGMICLCVGLWLAATGGREARAQLPFSLPGSNQFHLVAANSNNSTLIAAGSHNVYGAQLGGIGTAPAYLKLYDKATAPTCGTDIPNKVLIIPAAATAANGSASNTAIALGAVHAFGLGICVVLGIADNDNAAVPAATYIVNIDWK
jgi:hypothetical protein